MVAARVAQVFYYQLESDAGSGSTSARYTAPGQRTYRSDRTTYDSGERGALRPLTGP